MNPDRSVGVEGGRKPFYDVMMATERVGDFQPISSRPGQNFDPFEVIFS